jgi:hypothetical protein
MKCLTVRQPHASLIAVGAKTFETRSWRTNYRGLIAVHAGKKFCYEILYEHEASRAAKEALSYKSTNMWDYLEWDLPYGAVVAVAELTECWLISGGGFLVDNNRRNRRELPEAELPFGDFTPGRYAWELANVRKLPEPVPMRGQQGLWNLAESVEQETARQLGVEINYRGVCLWEGLDG